MFAHASLIFLLNAYLDRDADLSGHGYSSSSGSTTSLTVSFMRSIPQVLHQFADNPQELPTAPPPSHTQRETLEDSTEIPNDFHQYQEVDHALAIPPLGISQAHYYRKDELSRAARVIQDIDLSLGGLKDQPGSGKAVLILWINERGTVDRVETVTSNLDEDFERAVIAQFQTTLFRPAERQGVRVKSLKHIEVELLPR